MYSVIGETKVGRIARDIKNLKMRGSRASGRQYEMLK
jgi:hypothetical protein